MFAQLSCSVPFWPEIYTTSGYTAVRAHFEAKYGGAIGELPILDPISGTSYQVRLIACSLVSISACV